MVRDQRRGCERSNHRAADEGQFIHSVKIIAFNTEDGWSRDVTQEIATKLLDLNKEGASLGAAARELVERETGQSVTAVV